MSAKVTEEGAAQRIAIPQVAALRVLYRGGGGLDSAVELTLPLQRGSLAIGRGTDGLTLAEDQRASRVHAHLRCDEHGGLSITDAGSRNGTFVNGHRVERCALQDGDVLRIGDSLMLVRYEPALREVDTPMPGVIGVSPAMHRLRSTIRLLGPTNATVLLLGDSGTGKEVAARALHQANDAARPLVAVNCGAIPESLAESQLFGHVAGAFTGASAHPGFFRAAHGGTLFLDEVGELSTASQARLLRVLEERAVVPVGAVAPVRCEVRLIAATNRDLLQAVSAGTFRGDLYARLAAVTVHLPPLRERREDILLLLQLALGTSGPRLDADLLEALLLYRWPFNVRELVNTVTELRIRGAASQLLALVSLPDELYQRLSPRAARPSAPQASPPSAASTASMLVPVAPPEARPDKQRLEALLLAHKGVVVQVAQALRRSRRQVYRWLEQLEIDPAAFRG